MFRNVFFFEIFLVWTLNAEIIENFRCFSSLKRLECFDDGNFSSLIKIDETQRRRFQIIELIVKNSNEINVNDRTFESIQRLFNRTETSIEFRVEFQRYSSLKFSSKIFSRVFPENFSKKILKLEIFDSNVRPNFDENSFENLTIDTFELKTSFSRRQSVENLFDQTNIRLLKVNDKTIRSDFSQRFDRQSDRNSDETSFNSEGPADDSGEKNLTEPNERKIQTTTIEKDDDDHNKSFNFVPLIVIAVSLFGLLVIGLAYLLIVRKRSSATKSNRTGYKATATSEQVDDA